MKMLNTVLLMTEFETELGDDTEDGNPPRSSSRSIVSCTPSLISGTDGQSPETTERRYTQVEVRNISEVTSRAFKIDSSP